MVLAHGLVAVEGALELARELLAGLLDFFHYFYALLLFEPNAHWVAREVTRNSYADRAYLLLVFLGECHNLLFY